MMKNDYCKMEIHYCKKDTIDSTHNIKQISFGIFYVSTVLQVPVEN